MIQEKLVGWSALATAPLVAAALVWGTPWQLAIGGIVLIVTTLLAHHVRASTPVRTILLAALSLLIVYTVLPIEAQWGSGLLLLALLLVAGLLALLDGEPQQGNRAFRRLTASATLIAYLNAQFVYLNQTGGSAAWLESGEIVTAGALGIALFFLIRQALARQHQALVRRLSLAVTLLYVLYLALVISPQWAGERAQATIVLFVVAALWGSLVSLLLTVNWLPNKPSLAAVRPRRPIPAWRARLGDFLTLMKYRVSSLLLVTTLGAMVIAAQGWPGWALVGWVMLGGFLSVGGAGALNHYLDRDIDVDMGRTSQRPLPSGRIAPRTALLFGLLLSVLQFVIFWFKVNPLAAWLSTAGLLYYVVIYTMWLKRTSTQNIVIGGAAGAFPPLVGWAAVTGDLSLGAWYLFAIVFYWTPPHFWALALLRKDDYARAGVPMLPVVQGEHNTRVQILLYSLLMVALSIILVPLRMMGLLYLGLALLLNAKFLWDAIRLYRQPSNQSTLTLYKYSLLYLFLLFVAMAFDRALLM